MGLHKRFPVAHGEQDDVYASLELQQPAEKYIFPEKESNGANILQMVRDELMLDGNARLNLASEFPSQRRQQ